jgi:DNA modification methylase
MAKGEAGYELQCQNVLRQVFQIGPLAEKHDVSRSQIAKVIISDYKNMDSAKAQASNWILGKNIPNAKDFARLKMMLPIVGEYEDLRREYEYLRREYEDLRRPFSVTARDQWADVWDFDPTPAYPGKHPCEKPQPLLCHILKASTRPGAVVFDPFFGSGSLAVACRKLGRRFIGIDSSPEYHAIACRRIEAAQRQGMMEFADAP